MLKPAVFFLVLTSVYCKPLDSIVPQLTEDEKELMKNPLFPVLFREFLHQVVSLQTQNVNQNTNSHSSHFKEIIHQGNIGASSLSDGGFRNSATTILTSNSNVAANESISENNNLSSQLLSTTASQGTTHQNTLETKVQQDSLTDTTHDNFSSITAIGNISENNNLSSQLLSTTASQGTTHQNTLETKVQQDSVSDTTHDSFSSITTTDQHHSVEAFHGTDNKIVVTADKQNSLQQETSISSFEVTTDNVASQKNTDNIQDTADIHSYDFTRSSQDISADKITSGISENEERQSALDSRHTEEENLLVSENSGTHDTEDNSLVITQEHSQSTTSQNRFGERDDQFVINSDQINSTQNDSQEEEISEEVRPPVEETRYQFATRVDDNFNGNFQQREETREGDTITGSYAYDDGNILRTVTYEADAKGFRIVKDEIRPSVKAMQERSNLAQVQTFNNGRKVEYNVIQESEEED